VIPKAANNHAAAGELDISLILSVAAASELNPREVGDTRIVTFGRAAKTATGALAIDPHPGRLNAYNGAGH
jgi:hypothetical protein